MKRLALVALSILAAALPAFAVAPATDAYLPSVGHAQGQCPGGICSQWRTDAWIYNPSSSSATVQIYFLRRDIENATPASQTVTVAAGETKEYADIIYSLFNLDGVYGALRFVSNVDVVVTGRIYDENVQTNKGTGTAGQFFAGLSSQYAIGNGESTELVGLAQDGAQVWRSNFGFVETNGATATLEVKRLDAAGATLATKTYSLRARESKQFAITDIGGPLGTNQRVTVKVTGGSGRVLAFASRLDNRTGDPSTVEMTTKAAAAANTTGRFDGIVLTPDGTLVDGGIDLTITSLGLTGYAGIAGLPCGSDSYVVDFSSTLTTPATIGTDGSFSTQVDIPYGTSTTTYFTTRWTLSGSVGTTGVISGNLRSETTGGSGDWATCNATVNRAWRAGWTGSGQ
jgi:hypothetical protein